MRTPLVREIKHVADYEDAAEGWRAWVVDRDLLRSVAYPHYWTPRRTATAYCYHGCATHETPGEACGCGFSSVGDLSQVLAGLEPWGYRLHEEQVCVIGVVAQWGRIVEGTHGQRSLRAYPRELWVPYGEHELAEALHEAYDVPVGLRNFHPRPRSSQ